MTSCPDFQIQINYSEDDNEVFSYEENPSPFLSSSFVSSQSKQSNQKNLPLLKTVSSRAGDFDFDQAAADFMTNYSELDDLTPIEDTPSSPWRNNDAVDAILQVTPDAPFKNVELHPFVLPDIINDSQGPLYRKEIPNWTLPMFENTGPYFHENGESSFFNSLTRDGINSKDETVSSVMNFLRESTNSIQHETTSPVVKSLMRESINSIQDVHSPAMTDVPTAQFLSSFFLTDLEKSESGTKLEFKNSEPSTFLSDNRRSSKMTKIPCPGPNYNSSLFNLPDSNIPISSSFRLEANFPQVVTSSLPDTMKTSTTPCSPEKESLQVEPSKSDNNMVQCKNTPDKNDESFSCSLAKNLPKHFVTNFTYAIMCQLEPAEFTSNDRRGNRSCLSVGYKGVRCKHCKGIGRTGRYFPSSLKSFADPDKTLKPIYRHLAGCTDFPESTKIAIDRFYLTHQEELENKNKRHGGQRAFYRQIWNILHPNGEIRKIKKLSRKITNS